MVDFTFGSGETAYHLILEMYAQVGPKQGLTQGLQCSLLSVTLFMSSWGRVCLGGGESGLVT